MGAPSVPPEARTPTATGSVQLLDPPSKSGTLKARTWLRSFVLKCLEEVRAQILPSVCPLPGQLMDKLSSLGTVTTSSGSGRCLLLALANKLLHFVVEAFSPPLPRVSWSPNSCKTYLYSMLYKLYMYSPQHKGQEASVTLS